MAARVQTNLKTKSVEIQSPQRDVVGVACHRSRRGHEIAARLGSAEGADAFIMAEADMIRAAAGAGNQFHATNLSN